MRLSWLFAPLGYFFMAAGITAQAEVGNFRYCPDCVCEAAICEAPVIPSCPDLIETADIIPPCPVCPDLFALEHEIFRYDVELIGPIWFATKQVPGMKFLYQNTAREPGLDDECYRITDVEDYGFRNPNDTELIGQFWLRAGRLEVEPCPE